MRRSRGGQRNVGRTDQRADNSYDKFDSVRRLGTGQLDGDEEEEEDNEEEEEELAHLTPGEYNEVMQQRGVRAPEDDGEELDPAIVLRMDEATDRARERQWESTYGQLFNSPNTVPQVFKESESGRELAHIVHTPAVRPQQMSAKESLKHQIGGESRYEELRDMAREVAKKKWVAFASREEEDDVRALVESVRYEPLGKKSKRRIKIGLPQVSAEEAEARARWVKEKCVGGV